MPKPAPASKPSPKPKSSRKPIVTFETLREIAESASGMRNQDLWFVIRGGDHPTYTFFTTEQAETDDTVVIHSAAVPDPRPTVTFAEIGTGVGKPVDLMRIEVKAIAPHPAGKFKADAVFWSVSAVEKFLVPYYASVYGDKGGEYAQAVMNAMLHPDELTGERVFAMAHLPSSEYVIEEVPHVAALSPSGAQRLTTGGAHPIPAPGAQPVPAPSARTNGSRSRYARSSGR
jgi:hypothetical protein